MVQKVALLLVALLSTLSSLGAFAPPKPSYRHPLPSVSRVTRSCDVKRVTLRASSLEVGIENLPENSTDVDAIVASTARDDDSLPKEMLVLPRHSTEEVNEILMETEHLIRNMHKHSKKVEPKQKLKDIMAREEGGPHDAIFANTYVDLGKVDTVGFDYDYTLVTYTDELLELIYDMALKRLVHDRHYPLEMLEAGLAFDPFFSIRGRCSKTGTGHPNPLL